ncbi:unnamed protein product [Arctogadus glacialis]
MALQWLMWGTAAVVLAMLVQPAVPQPSCEMFSNYHGVPGIPGAYGPHGADGPKGEKGDTGDGPLHAMGRKGEPGVPGPAGRTGPKGEQGPHGQSGFQGPKGESGGRTQRPEKQHSFFSYKRGITQKPARERPIVFNRDVVPDLDTSLKGENLTHGVFSCKIQGVYYFTYHISAKELVCLKLMKGTKAILSLCDSSSSHLVTSGSLVFELAVGDKVFLQPTQHNKIVTSPGLADNTFTGMLLFPST